MGSTWSTNAPKAYHSDSEEKSFYQSATWRRQRAAFLKGHPTGKCEVCGTKPTRVHVHHKRGVKVDPEGLELMLVCPTCHEIGELLYRRSRNKYTEPQVLALLALALYKQAWMATRKASGNSSQPTEKMAA